MTEVRGTARVFAVVAAYLVFLTGARGLASSVHGTSELEAAVVIPPVLQVLLYMGDRNLAANIEATRLLATGGDVDGRRTDYFRRLQLGVGSLNPCHEDNYYLANALLAWAGSVEPALEILRDATKCRFWDEVPPFLLGYDLYFFRGDRKSASALLNDAASRSTENRAGFRKLAIMIEAEGQRDARAAREFLAAQARQSNDQKLRTMLNRRIVRLDGLIALQDAQAIYEKKHARMLEDPQDLIVSGTIAKFPADPMGLGYEFRDGQFVLKEMRVPAAEAARK